MSIAANRARYEGTALQLMMEFNGRTVCDRCYCCDVVHESAPCWQCGGFEPDYEDEWGDDCDVCGGEGRLYFTECIGRCDENGTHKAKEKATA